jgi:hypothetical protein
MSPAPRYSCLFRETAFVSFSALAVSPPFAAEPLQLARGGALSERLPLQAMTSMLIQVRLAGTGRFHLAPFPIFCAKPDVHRGQS